MRRSDQNKDFNSEYEEFLDTFLHKAIREYWQYSDADQVFYNVGCNLIYLLQQKAEPFELTRDYTIESVKLRDTYNVLIKCVKEIKETIPEEILIQSKYRFIYSIDKFLDGILDSTDTKDILLDKNLPEKYVSYVSLSCDCIAKAYEIINDEVFMLGGDFNEE